MTKKVIITYGTFDLYHVGHVNLLRRLSEIGDKLVVGVSTDEFNSTKGKKSVFSFEERLEIVRSCRYVSSVFPENDWNQKRKDIIRERATTFAMGTDWAGRFDDLSDICEVLYLPRTENISTTDIKQFVSSMQADRILGVKAALNNLNKCVEML
jgi:glycerol-3-phosphate cytidylyltransferase